MFVFDVVQGWGQVKYLYLVLDAQYQVLGTYLYLVLRNSEVLGTYLYLKAKVLGTCPSTFQVLLSNKQIFSNSPLNTITTVTEMISVIAIMVFSGESGKWFKLSQEFPGLVMVIMHFCTNRLRSNTNLCKNIQCTFVFNQIWCSLNAFVLLHCIWLYLAYFLNTSLPNWSHDMMEEILKTFSNVYSSQKRYIELKVVPTCAVGANTHTDIPSKWN